MRSDILYDRSSSTSSALTGKVHRGRVRLGRTTGPVHWAWEDRAVTITLHDFDGEHSLTITAGDLLADAAVVASGHEPNGYFWEGLVQFAWPDIAERLDFDSEAGMFCAVGTLSEPCAAQSCR
jgi:hypothetical protein